MSQGLGEALQSYQFSRNERAVAASSLTETPPSPLESLQSRSPHPSNRARPQLFLRPHSSERRSSERIIVQIIEEGSDRISNLPFDSPRKSCHRVQSPEGIDGQKLARAIPLFAEAASEGKKILNTQSSSAKSYEAPSISSAGKEKPSRPLWARTRSGGVWYRRRKDASSHSTHSGVSNPSNLEHTWSANINIVPLKPPPSPKRLETSPTNRIVVELPFGHHEDAGSSSKSSSDKASVSERRRSSIDVKRLFSAPLTIFRRSAKEKSSRVPSPSRTQTIASSTRRDAARQRWFAKSDQTTVTLERVSSLLEAHTRSKLASRLRSWTLKSVSSTTLSDPTQSRQSTRASGGAFRSKSLEHVMETTSSILNLHMGSTPGNSLAERATYKVKRSPSAETEEFLKIDISIRGGTSYLASEARRLSTPPLPENDQSGWRKGFFFDYTAPASHSCADSTAVQQESALASFEQGDHRLLTKPGIHRSVTSTSIQRSPSRKMISKARTGDWYDTQLADLDATSLDIDDVLSPESTLHGRCRQKCQARLAEVNRQRYEAQLDYSIPEHLPSSPLCPRNPRY